MKVVAANEGARLERLAVAEGSNEEAFMQKAGEGVADAIQKLMARLHLKPHILLLCGKGNNGGDALCAGAALLAGDFIVHAALLSPLNQISPLAQRQAARFKERGGILQEISSAEELDLNGVALLVDGLLGTGFHGELAPLFAQVIEKANASGLPILSIDIPSGIDGNTGEIGSVAIQATETVFLEFPKTGCFFGKSWEHVGKVTLAPFGLPPKYKVRAKEDFSLIEKSEIKTLLPEIKRTRHKYEAGYCLGIGGSPHMPGAALLSSIATLKSGAGMIRLFHPPETPMGQAPLEVIHEPLYSSNLKRLLEEQKKASALFVGPGMGKTSAALRLLKKLLPLITHPCVIDADALNLIAEKGLAIPPQAILTPHHGEMKRLLHITKTLDLPTLFEKTQAFANTHNVIIVLKGSPTLIFEPHHTPRLSIYGDPGMATAGSGDVLTGIIAAFLAQKKKPLEAALCGVVLHGIAGELAAGKHTSYCMTATDIIEALPDAFRELSR